MGWMPENVRGIARDWYRVSFNALYPIIYAHRTVEAARGEALFAVERVPIAASDAVLDLCCGNGRHMAHLREGARRVVGLDYSPDLLALARASLGPDAPLVRADMRHNPFDGVFDVVVSFFTSFGYFLEEEENLSVVRGVARALKPGGRFFIDYFCAAFARDNLKPSTVRMQDAYEIREERWIDEELRRVNKTMVVLKDGNTVSESGESVQLYGRDEFADLLTRGGLQVEEVFGDYSGVAANDSCPRMIVTGRRA